ncbi:MULTISPECIES: hypothetical protein [Pseudomonas syringae group]|uniref:Uncharacterized protein n=1 Tax=Pseudomonas syringae pv. actinidiae TaxID=103796 RepID=M1J9B4_PSESF|nr:MULTISPECIES: hypothetical protein [Pseudomonas syringae group]EPN54817.1 hypothetical protein A235_39176 [Pseudomonas syringae pv. actinidiae ICMP 19079]AGE82316.1 hypothetical protein [Pseudomonas syringae pv. actinidiae]AGE82442.1 hypothetical protein [Pseudomonas syringae pv. actinidiae]AQX58235.1 hypothetical protein B1R35_08740 [Pseudomonas syringae pv. actinidiae]AQX64129.1 hypothetical protein B1F85_08730 [Pseudomonas syringae pv. actinidiae]
MTAKAVEQQDLATDEVQILQLWGTHGTSRSRADDIYKSSFVLKPGRIGIGAYFWTAIDNSEECIGLAKRLATAWATKSLRSGQYADDEDDSLAIVEVSIEVGTHEVLPLDDPKLTYRLWSLLRRKLSEMLGIDGDADWAKVNLGKHQRDIHGFIEAFILELEENMDQKFKVIFKSQICPTYSDPVLPYIGNHSCFAVRDAGIIKIMNVTN